MATVEKLMKQVSEVKETTGKITIVGVGQVGMAATFSLMIQVCTQCVELFFKSFFKCS